MKKLIYGMVMAALVSGCYADKGNYDFDLDKMNDFGDIEISPKPVQSNAEDFSYILKFPQLTAGQDSVVYKLSVRVKQKREDFSPENLEYHWTGKEYRRFRTIIPGELPEDEDTIEINDKEVTVDETNNGDMDIVFYPFSDLSRLQRSYRLCVTDKATTLKRYYTFTITPRVTYENSIFVLHGNTEGNHILGNVQVTEDDVFIEPDAYGKVLPDSVKNGTDSVSVAKANLFKNSKFLAGTLNSIFNQGRAWNGIYMWVANTDGMVYVVNPYQLWLDPSYNREVLYPVGTIVPQWVHQPYHITNDPRLFATTTNGELLVSSMTGATPNNGNSNACIDALMLYKPGSSSGFRDDRHVNNSLCQFTMAVEDQISGAVAQIVAYDQLNKRFLFTTSTSSYNSPAPTAYRQALEDAAVNSVYGTAQPIQDPFIDYSTLRSSSTSPDLPLTANNKELIYMHGGSVIDPTGVYAYFLDNQNRVYLYTLTYCGSSGKPQTRAIDTTPQYSISGALLTNMTGVTKDTPFLYWPTAAYTMVFYAEGGDLYRYNTQSNQKTLVWSAPDGWDITKIKVKTTYSPQEHNYEEFDGSYASNRFIIALGRGNEGAIAEIKLMSNGARDILFEPQIYEGFERIIDTYFAYAFKTQDVTVN